MTCSANGITKCTPSPSTLFSTAPRSRTTPLCPACTMTTDSDITKIITINVTRAAIITNFLELVTKSLPTCSRGSWNLLLNLFLHVQEVLLRGVLFDFLKGFLIDYHIFTRSYGSDIS